MTKFFLRWAAICAFAIGGVPALAQSSAAPTELGWAQEKFKYAVIGSEFGKKKCEGLAKIHIEAAKVARKSYKEVLVAAGLANQAGDFERAASRNFGRVTCRQIMREKNVTDTLAKVPFLTEELLLALHYADLKSCGIHNEIEWGNLMTYVSPYVEKIKQRPDGAFLVPVAKMRSKKIAETCSGNIIPDDAFLLGSTKYGLFMWEAVQFANNRN